jgi:hypothetical protein
MFYYVLDQPRLTCFSYREANTPNAVAAAPGGEGGKHGLQVLVLSGLRLFETSANRRSFSLSPVSGSERGHWIEQASMSHVAHRLHSRTWRVTYRFANCETTQPRFSAVWRLANDFA